MRSEALGRDYFCPFFMLIFLRDYPEFGALHSPGRVLGSRSFSTSTYNLAILLSYEAQSDEI